MEYHRSPIQFVLSRVLYVELIFQFRERLPFLEVDKFVGSSVEDEKNAVLNIWEKQLAGWAKIWRTRVKRDFQNPTDGFIDSHATNDKKK